MQIKYAVFKTAFTLSFILTVTTLATLIVALSDISNLLAAPLYTDISGVIGSNTTWTAAGSPYILNGDVTINQNVTLTIEPGVIIKANGYAGYPNFILYGTLNAQGTAGNPIVFTSNRDDRYGGDTNGDGGASLPAKGDWGNIHLYGSATAYFDNVKILYAYQGISADAGSNLTDGITITMTNSLVESISQQGIYIYDYDTNHKSYLYVSNSTFHLLDGTGVIASGNGMGNLSLQDNTFSDTQSAVAIDTSSASIVNNQFVNSRADHGYVRVTGGLTLQGNSATGESRPLWLGGTLASNLTLNSAIPVYGLEYTFSVGVGYTLTIEPGVTIKSQSGYQQTVFQGGLNAQGTSANPVVFTSFRDDQYGGDSNANGDASLPQPGDWGGLSFGGKSKANLNYTIIRFANTALSAYASDAVNEAVTVSIENSRIEESSGTGVSIYDNNSNLRSSVSISNSLFSHNGYSAVDITGLGVNTPLIRNSIFSENRSGLSLDVPSASILNNSFIANSEEHARVRVNGALAFTGNSASGESRLFWLDGTISSNLLLDSSIPVYGLGTSLTIAQGYTLTVAPGVVLKSQVPYYYYQLNVQGVLDVQGEPNNPVVFTSYRDDEYGGDTNYDGDASLPASNDWGGIVLGNKAKAYLAHTIVRYASTGLSASVGDLANEAVAVTIRHSRFESHGGSGVSITDNNANLRSTVAISDSIFQNNGYIGVQISGIGVGTPILSGNTFSENSSGIMLDTPNATLRNNQFANNQTANGNIRVNGAIVLSGNSATGTLRPFWLGGTINSSLQLDAGLSVYGFDGSFVLANGYTLTIPAGTVIKSQSNYYYQDQIQGVLDVQGSAAQPVVFTSYRDDQYGGDSNGDGDASLPQNSDWGGLFLGGKSKAYLKYAIVRFAGNGIQASASDATNEAVSIQLDHSRVEQSGGSGLSIYDANANLRSTVLISYSTFSQNGTGISISGAGIHTPTIRNNVFADNDLGLSIDTPGAFVYDNSFANNADSHARITINGALDLNGNNATGAPRPFWLGGTIASNLTLSPTLPVYGFMGPLVIARGYTLTLLPGSVIKSQNYYYNQLQIDGALDARGSAAKPVVLTSMLDDEYGGDSNGDGGATLPNANDWSGILVGANGRVKLDYTHVRFAANALSASTSDATNEAFVLQVTNSRIEDNGGHGIYAVDGNANLRSSIGVTNTTVAHNGNSGISIMGVGVFAPTIAGNLFKDNPTGLLINTPAAVLVNNMFTDNGDAQGNVVVNGSLTLSGNRTTGKPRPFWLGGTIQSNLTLSSTLPIYGIQDNLTIPQNYTLTLQPGVILKSTWGGMIINGTLNVEGTETAPVIMTSTFDDDAGGDSDNDQGATLPAAGQWNGIQVIGNGRLVTNYAQVRYATNGVYAVASTSASEALSITLNNSIFENNSQSGLLLQDDNSNRRSTLIANHSIFRNNYGGVTIYNPATLHIALQKNQIAENQEWGLANYSPNNNVDARNQWWGAPTGPQHATNLSGTGNAVTDGVLFDPWSAFATDAPTDSELPTLAIGTQVTFALKPLQPFYLKIQPQPDKNVLLTIDGNLTTGLTLNSALRVLTRHGGIPFVSDFDQEAMTALPNAHLEIPIAPTIGGDYYLLVYAPFVSAGNVNGTVRASYVDMSITKVSPNAGGNAGNLTVNIEGTSLSDPISATLISPAGVRLAAIDQLASSDTLLFATFNLSGTLSGNYTLELKRTSDGETVTKANAVAVHEGLGARLKVHLEGPENVRPGRVYTYKLHYENVGDADMPAPFLGVSTSGPGAILYAEGYTSTQQLIWLASGEGTRGDLLNAGGKGIVEFDLLLQESTSISVGEVRPTNDDFNWQGIQLQMSELGVSANEWELIKEIFGNTESSVYHNLRILHREFIGNILLDELLEFGVWSVASVATYQYEVNSSALEADIWYTYQDAKADITLLTYSGDKLIPVTANSPKGDFNPTNPIILITHGWNDAGNTDEYRDMARVLESSYGTEKNVIVVSWKEGAASPPIVCVHPSNPLCARAVTRRIDTVATVIKEKLEELHYNNWEQTIYIGHSFGNAVNAYVSNKSGKHGTALLLDPAAKNGFSFGTQPNYRDSFGRGSIAIYTKNIADDWNASSHRIVLYSPPDCGGVICSGTTARHSAGKKLITCWLSGPGATITGCGKIASDTITKAKAKAFIEAKIETLQLEEEFLYRVEPSGKLIREQNECYRVRHGRSCKRVYVSEVDFVEPQVTLPINVVRPTDPNDKIGPAGIGAQRVVATDSTLDYIINFENVGTATAPVQELRITDQLDPNLDLSTLQLTSISYGGHTILLDNNNALEYTANDEPPANVITGTVQEKMLIDISAKLNTQNGLITWFLRTIDSATRDLPEDALAGFLPPEDGSGRGQGYVTFSIKPKATTSTGTVIKNKASIVFDTNEAIATNEVSNLVGEAVDLALQADVTGQATTGAVRTIRFTVFNDGPATANNVNFAYTLPASTTVSSLVPSQGNCNVTSCSLGALQNGAHAVVEVKVVTNRTGTITDTASVTSNAIELNALDNSVSAKTSVDKPSLTPTLNTLGANSGAPGSRFVVKGTNFQPNTQFAVYVTQSTAEAAETELTPVGSVTTDNSGNFVVTLMTSASTKAGVYAVGVGDNPRRSVAVTVDNNAGLQQPTAQGTQINMPEEFNQSRIYLPLVQR